MAGGEDTHSRGGGDYGDGGRVDLDMMGVGSDGDDDLAALRVQRSDGLEVASVAIGTEDAEAGDGLHCGR